MNRDGIHPTADQLRAFTLGRLDDIGSAEIEAHLGGCPRCCEALAGLDTPDAFQSRIKAAGRPADAPDASSPTLSGRAPKTPPELLGHPRYQILGVLGGGGMGTVYKAEHRLLDRPVVVKVINPELVHDEGLVLRFQREARLAARLSHPNVVAVYEAEQVGPTYLLVMEYIGGETLSELVRKRGPLPVAAACELARQAAAGLQHIHEQGLVHRDIKPANLILTDGGQVKVLDLGLALLKAGAPQRDLTMPQQSMGSSDYMAPEQWQDSHEVDIRADIYSLGCTLYYLLAGSPPFGVSKAPNAMRQMYAHSLAPVPPIREKRPDVPEALAAVLARMLAKDRAERHAAPAEVGAALAPFAAGCDLSGYLSSGTVRTGPPDASRPPAARPTRRAWIAAAITGAAAVAGGVGWYMSLPARRPVPSGPPIKVGVLHSLTGTMSTSEKPVAEATLLAVEQLNERGGVLGRPVEAVVEDGASDALTFARLAEKLITQDGVCPVFGCWTSASRKEVKPIFEKHGHLLFYPVQYEGLEQSPNIVYLGAAPNQQILPAVRWCCAFLGKKRLFLVGSDYVFPHCANAIIKDHAKELKAEVGGEEYLPLSGQDVAAAVAAAVKKIEAARPDIILNTINGDSNLAFFRALRAAGVTSEKIPTISFSIAEEDLAALNARDVTGDYAAWNYFMSIPGDRNKAFIRRFQAKYGRHRLLSDPMEAAYFGVHLWAQAAEAAGSADVAAVRKAIKGQSFDAPGGPVRIDPATQHTFKTVRIGKIVEGRRFAVAYTSEEPIEPAPYPSTRPKKEWDKFLHHLHLGWGGRWEKPGQPG